MKKIFLLTGLCLVHFFDAVQSAGNGVQPFSAGYVKPMYLLVDGRSNNAFQIAEHSLQRMLCKRLLPQQTRQTYIYCGMPMNEHDVKTQRIRNILAGALQGGLNNVTRSLSFEDDSIVVTELLDC